MKKMAFGLVLLFVAAAAIAQFVAPTEFRGVAFGSSLKALGSATIVENDGDFKCYYRKGDSMSIGDASLKSIEYCYYKDQLEDVMINYSGFTNYSTIKNVLTQKYGEPAQPNEFLKNFWWGLGQVVAIKLEYSDVTQEGGLYYRYGPVSKKHNADDKAKNKAASSDV